MWAPALGGHPEICAKVPGDPELGNEAGKSLATQQANGRGQKSQSLDHRVPEALSALVRDCASVTCEQEHDRFK